MTPDKTWATLPSACFVSGGFENKKGGTPTCSITNDIITVTNFHEILFRNLDGRYPIKI
jgi:hypothetical protein